MYLFVAFIQVQQYHSGRIRRTQGFAQVRRRLRAMSPNKFLKCTCQGCGGHIEFPVEGIGQTIPCPHCGVETELMLESPEPTSAVSSRSLKWLIAGVIILVLGVVGVVGALIAARQMLKKSGPNRAASQTAPGRLGDTNAAVVPAMTTLIEGFLASPVLIERTPGMLMPR